MPSKRSGNDLVLFSSDDPRPLVEWLCDTYGLQTILKSLSEQRPGAAAPAKRAYKKRASKEGGSGRGSNKGGGKRGRPKGSKNVSKKGGAKKASKKAGGKSGKGRAATSGGSEAGNH